MASEASAKAKRNYEKTRQVKRVSFNTETEKELLDFANSIDDFSNFVKQYLEKKLKEEKALK